MAGGRAAVGARPALGRGNQRRRRRRRRTATPRVGAGSTVPPPAPTLRFLRFRWPRFVFVIFGAAIATVLPSFSQICGLSPSFT